MADAARKSYAFGPVPSRRLGRSLGVDPVPFKTCTYDCIYCQLGSTTFKTVERREYAPVEEILADVAECLGRGPKPDYVTLAGSGEPTLHSGLGRIIEGIRKLTTTTVAILTNGSLLSDPQVRADCAKADLVIPSLDAGDEELFQKIHRPAPGLTLEKHVRGIVDFRREFRGRLYIEVFLLDGINANEKEVLKIRARVDRIGPDKVQLNTASRPPTESYARAVPADEMQKLARLFNPPAEVAASGVEMHQGPGIRADENQVLDLVSRHPCTADDVAAGLGIDAEQAKKLLENLAAQDRIEAVVQGGRQFFRAK